MNEQLQQALAEMLDKTIEATGKATDFMVAEIPDVIQQLLMWKMAEAICKSVLVSLAAAAILFITHKLGKISEKHNEKEGYVAGPPYWVVILIGVIFSAATCSPTLINKTLITIQIWIAPKVYLIEYAASLAK